MSRNNFEEISCPQVLHAVILYIDQEIEELADCQALELHIAQCLPCAQTLALEKAINQQVKALLDRSCREKASERLRQNINSIIERPQFEWRQSITYTEITSDSITQTHLEIRESFEEE